MVNNRSKTIISLIRLPIAGIFLLTFIVVQCYGKYISLNSDDWTLRDKTNQYIITNVTVPGGLYTDLFSARIIDDPLYDKNDVNYRNFSSMEWIWSKNFSVDAADLQASNDLYLVINGIDTISSIYLNGLPVGQTNNMFVKYKYKVNYHLHPGENKIDVVIQSPINYTKAAASNYKDKFNYTIVPECWPDVYNGECHANFIRKMAASFSWDWGPAFPSSGIWLPIGIEAIQPNGYFEDFWLFLGESEDGSNWTIDLILNILRTLPETSVDVQVSLSTNHYLDEYFEREFVIYNGSIVLSQSSNNYGLYDLNISRSQVDLWWPNGMSVYSNYTVKPRSATLYNLTVTVTSEKTRQSKTKRIGFRSIKLIQERPKAGKIKLPDGRYEDAFLPGLSFRFEVNGVPLYIKGTNIIPSSVFPENETRDKAYVKRLLSTVAYSSMNMVRVWGGGIYQTDYFYDLADELGILIWQDFMFACMTYPSNIQFLRNVETEVIQQVIRLAHHPSIALWSGNNENEIAIATGWWPEVVVNKARYVDDYLQLNRDTIKKTVHFLDAHRIFISSSPSNGDETESEGGLAFNPGDYLFGDVHFYSYTADAWNQSQYPEARFISEYGFESYSSLKSYASVMPREKLVYPLSDSLEHRQHHPNGTLEMEAMVANYFRLPTEMGTINALQKMIYLSQCLQAMAIKAETEVYLRNRKVDPFTGSKLTWGAMYWMLNDIWVSTSWSSVEFGGKWKMLQYYVKDIFNPVHGQIYLKTDSVSGSQVIESVINNDYTGRVELVANINVYQLDSFIPIPIASEYFQIDSYSADIIFTINLNQTIISPQVCPSLENCLIQLNYNLIPSSSSSDYGENFLIPVKPKELELKNPNFNILSITKVDKYAMRPLLYLNYNYNVFKIKFTSERPALFVWLDFDDDSVAIDGVFSDNGFMMVEPEKTIYFQTYDLSCNTKRIREHLTITHLKENL